jgi:hypothetical protein
VESWLADYPRSRSVKGLVDLNLRYSSGTCRQIEHGVGSIALCKVVNEMRRSVFGSTQSAMVSPTKSTMLDAPVGRSEWEVLVPDHLADEPEELYGTVKNLRSVVTFQDRYTCVLFDIVTGFRWRLGLVRQDLPHGLSRSRTFHPLANVVSRLGTLDRLTARVLSCLVDDAGDLESGGVGMFPVAWGSFSMHVDTQGGRVISQAGGNG